MLSYGFLTVALALLSGTNAPNGPAAFFNPLHGIESHDGGHRLTEAMGWLEPTSPPEAVPSKRSVVLLDVTSSAPLRVRLYWWRGDLSLSERRVVTAQIEPGSAPRTVALDLDTGDRFPGLSGYRLHIHGPPGTTFSISAPQFVTAEEVPDACVPSLLGFQGFTSKRHYQPGERLDYGAILDARCYPDRSSSKILTVRVTNEAGREVARAFQQYGLRAGARYKEIRGVVEPSAPLAPGPYTMYARSVDQRSDLTLESTHTFVVQGPDDAFVYETPFKFVKDFSIVRGPDDRWHIFSITGDLMGSHDWADDGQERTFSHASSDDLRHWTEHPPVISISHATYPDSKERFKDRNVWAPHVIAHAGRYWMFYTSVNEHVSQSISLATSEDLFHWTEYENNPVFTPEGIPWATWGRDRWGACRDACVIKQGERFYLYVTADVRPSKDSDDTGAIIVARSTDLVHWEAPAIAVRGPIACESPQVWPLGETFYLLTSSHGAGTWTSAHPMHGWTPTPVPRPDIARVQKYPPVGSSYAEEIAILPDGGHLMAALTFHYWGNSIYLFRMITDGERVVGYESPWPCNFAD